MGYSVNKDDIKILDKVEDKAFEIDILMLENDLDALGWDQPHNLYAVMGEPGNYRLEKISEMSGHPVDWMKAAVCGTPEHPGGGRLADDVLGVAVANEGWKHPSAQDFERHYPDDWARFEEMADLSGVDKTDKEKMYHHLNKVLDHIHDQIPPHANPRRLEIRSVMVLMRDGRGIGVHRTRGEDAKVFEIGDGGRVIKGMRALLDGCWPGDPDMNEPTPERS